MVILSQELEYLGVIWRTISLPCSLPSRKVESTSYICSTLLVQKRVKLRSFAAIVGSFAWASAAVPYAQAHFRCLQLVYIRESSRQRGIFRFFAPYLTRLVKSLRSGETSTLSLIRSPFPQLSPIWSSSRTHLFPVGAHLVMA